jgi:hypothetical protein
MSEDKLTNGISKGLPTKFVENIRRRNKNKDGQAESGTLIIWPSHQTVFSLFQKLQTQWRTDFGQRTGLDYAILPYFFDLLDVDNDETIDSLIPKPTLDGDVKYIVNKKLTLQNQLQIVEIAYLNHKAMTK